MNGERNDTSDRERLLDEVVTAYLKAAEAGQAPDHHELLARHADLAPDLAEFLADQEQVERWTAPLRAAGEAARASGIAADTPLPDAAPTDGAPASGPRPVEGFELLEEIGQGGMSVVYKARQKGLNRLVALKLLRADPWLSADSLRRFRNEAEIVAGLDHPGIVPIYEVSERDGRLYFSMKLMDGGSLAGQLPRFMADPKAAAGLVAAVARAVHHAHQRGVLHRDLKPSNILLDAAGRPHVTDFGLARRVEADSSLTQSGAIVGTPGYMAPEQAAGRRAAATTATDVYGLGAVLYALLTGMAPFQGETVLETLERVKEQDPQPPRRRNPKVDRDLETVCLKCLHKEPQRRYESAQAVADDLERWLSGEPIRARPSGRRERLGKWVRRRPALAGLVMVSVLAVLGLLGGLLWHNGHLREAAERERAQAEQARRQRDRAEEERRWARQAVDDMYSQVAERWLKRQPRMEPVQQEFLEKALRYYAREAEQEGDDPEVRRQVALAQYRLGTIYYGLGRSAEAHEAYGQAIALYARLAADFPGAADYQLNLAHSHLGLGNTALKLGRQEEAAGAFRDSIETVKRSGGGSPASADSLALLVQAQDALAMTLAEAGKHADAERTYRDTIDLGGRLVKESSGRPESRFLLANTHNNLANLLAGNGLPGSGRNQEAEPEYREAVRLFGQLAEDVPTEPNYRERWSFSLGNLAVVLLKTNRSREAVPLLRQAAALQQRLAEDFPAVPDYAWELAATQGNLGIVLRNLGDYAGAKDSYGQAIATYRKLVARFPADRAHREAMGLGEGNLGNLLGHNLNRLGEAEEAYRRALEIQQKLVAEFSGVPVYRVQLANTALNLGGLLSRNGRARDAVEPLDLALKAQEELVAAAPDNIAYHRDLAVICNSRALASVWYQGPPCPEASRAVALARRATGLEPQSKLYWLTLAVAHYRAGNGNDSLAALRRARELGAAEDLAGLLAAMAHWQMGDREGARRHFGEAVRLMDRDNAPDKQVLRFRAEAAALLGIAEQAKEKEGSPLKK
jgi:tetratricopeptide (TPR) repeat protein/tRNA A-37 threonylcarbamoyl transferase component Bud32